jgi:endonuclease/exonuclease/phosphatase (EEP) superfamily protein YafD
MVTKILTYRYIQLALTSLIVLGTFICVFTPNYFLFKMGARFAVQIMLGYLVLGFVFLIFRQHKLMFTSFACCAGLCLFLKYASDGQLSPPLKTDQQTLNVAHFNVSASIIDYKQTIDEILAVDADVITLQEITPDWDAELKESLQDEYPYSKTIVRLDPFGLAIYSRFPLLSADTFMFENTPNIVGTVQLEGKGQEICFIVSHALPVFYTKDYERQRKHLMAIAKYSSSTDCPIITIGDYNAVPWSYEIQDFKAAAKLNDSRRGFMPASNGSFSLFQIPSDHIFYSDQLECTEFQEINSPSSGHLGIKGSYQFNNKSKPSL